MPRPVEKYSAGMHHLAQPTLDPRATLEFYVDVMGAKITHCISSKGWRPGHFDYIHMYLDLGKGDNIAMFYYFGAKTKEQIPKYGTHHSFGAGSIDELTAWKGWLEENGHDVIGPHEYEVMTSVYAWDPNGRLLEIAANHRELTAIDADDAELTAQALLLAADEHADTIDTMWAHKARLIEEREGAVTGPALFLPGVDEFKPFIAAISGESDRTTRGNFTVLQGDRVLTIDRPRQLPESMWHSVGTGGVKGTIQTHDADQLTIV